MATFTYTGAPIFSPFIQEVKIQSTGASVAGTDLKFIFTPELDKIKPGKETLIQLVDEKTGSLVNSPEIEVDAVLLNKTGNSFRFKFEPKLNYTLRGKAEGYNDYIKYVFVEW